MAARDFLTVLLIEHESYFQDDSENSVFAPRTKTATTSHPRFVHKLYFCATSSRMKSRIPKVCRPAAEYFSLPFPRWWKSHSLPNPRCYAGVWNPGFLPSRRRVMCSMWSFCPVNHKARRLQDGNGQEQRCDWPAVRTSQEELRAWLLLRLPHYRFHGYRPISSTDVGCLSHFGDAVSACYELLRPSLVCLFSRCSSCRRTQCQSTVAARNKKRLYPRGKRGLTQDVYDFMLT